MCVYICIYIYVQSVYLKTNIYTKLYNSLYNIQFVLLYCCIVKFLFGYAASTFFSCSFHFAVGLLKTSYLLSHNIVINLE